MSVRLMSAVFSAEFEPVTITANGAGRRVMPSTLKLVLLALADHANDEGEGAYPSMTLLEKKTGLSRISVSNALKALRQTGVIERIGISKRGTTNYSLTLSPASKLSTPRLVNPVHRASKPSLPVAGKPSLLKPSDKPSSTIPADDVADSSEYTAILAVYEANFGMATPVIADELRLAAATYPAGWVGEAMKRALVANVRKWPYVVAILKNWQANGFGALPPRSNGAGQVSQMSGGAMKQNADGSYN